MNWNILIKFLMLYFIYIISPIGLWMSFLSFLSSTTVIIMIIGTEGESTGGVDEITLFTSLDYTY